MPSPAVNRTTPVFVTVMLPTVVTGLLATAMPDPGMIPTLVTVPLLVVLAAAVTLPYASSVTVGQVMIFWWIWKAARRRIFQALST